MLPALLNNSPGLLPGLAVRLPPGVRGHPGGAVAQEQQGDDRRGRTASGEAGRLLVQEEAAHLRGAQVARPEAVAGEEAPPEKGSCVSCEPPNSTAVAGEPRTPCSGCGTDAGLVVTSGGVLYPLMKQSRYSAEP